MRHSKRRKLNTEDINHALKLRNLEPLYGYGVSSEVGGEPLFRRAAGTQDVFYLPDTVVNLTDLITKPRLPTLPTDVSWRAHWLAVEGVQPAIPENPSVGQCRIKKKKRKNEEGGRKKRTRTKKRKPKNRNGRQ